mmetsp:Transcript_20529/g.56692  ORF Transcript_20529/g.56692 Transcript_20529/m.56692 type:complete len:121 (-) Transcript_20529:175-537(-)
MAPLPQIFSAVIRVAMVGAPILGRAFMDAYKQAMINAAARQAANKNSAVGRTSRMTHEEAAKILDIKDVLKPEEIQERYQKLHSANDPTKGGSAYLQEKLTLAFKVVSERPAPQGPKPEA